MGLLWSSTFETPYEDELFRVSRWAQMGRSRHAEPGEGHRFRVPGVLPILKKLYAAALGQRLFVSLIVLKPLEHANTHSRRRNFSSRDNKRRLSQLTQQTIAAIQCVRRSCCARFELNRHLYSAICKTRLHYSRRIAGAEMRRVFHTQPASFRDEYFRVAAGRVAAEPRVLPCFRSFSPRILRIAFTPKRTRCSAIFRSILRARTPYRQETRRTSKVFLTRNSLPRRK